MATEWRTLEEGTHVLLSGSNIGVITQEEKALLVDTGLDKDSARRALKALEDLGVTLEAILITHGHADHFGGAGWVRKRKPVPIYAPPVEAAFVSYPILEPLFLHSGAAPFQELLGKFTLAEQSAPVDHLLMPGPCELIGLPLEIIPLRGHAPEQVGIAIGKTLYCGDALFPEETLQRHPILFCADLDAWLETLERLPGLGYTYVVPGHGEPPADVAQLAKGNADRLREIRALVYDALAMPQEATTILQHVAGHYELNFTAPTFFLLALTTIQAALTSLQRAGEAEPIMEANRILWQQA